MKVVRVTMRDRPQRSRLERVLMLAPEASRRAMDPVYRLPPGSRLRTLMLRLVFQHAYSALNRGDLDLLKRLFYWPEMALNFVGDIGPDFRTRYEGRDACFDAYVRWREEWGGVKRVPVGFVDRGDVVVSLAHEIMRGESSGLQVEREVGQRFRLRGAGVIEQTEYRSWAEALAHEG